MSREDHVEVILMLLCWTPMNVTYNIMILGTLSKFFGHSTKLIFHKYEQLCNKLIVVQAARELH